MNNVDTPAGANGQLLFGPDSPGDSHTDAPAMPGGPHDHASTSPIGSPAGDAASPTVATPVAPMLPTSSPVDAGTLARLIADGRKPRSQRSAELEPYRDVLLAERRTGASIRLMAQSLAKIGVMISEETLRVWLLRQKMPKRRRPRKKTATMSKTKIGLSSSPRPVTPAAMPPTPAPASYNPYGPRRGPRIARDDF